MKSKNFDLVLFSSVFAGLFVISNVIAVKEVQILGMVVASSFITYPLTFVVSNIVNERLGIKEARKVVVSGLIVMLVIILLLGLTYYFPANDIEVDNAYRLLFEKNIVIVIASLVAFIISQVVNFTVYDGARLSKFMKFIFSAFIAIFIDAILFNSILLFTGLRSLEIYTRISSQTILGGLIVLLSIPFFYLFTLDIKTEKPKTTKSRKTTPTKTKKTTSTKTKKTPTKTKPATKSTGKTKSKTTNKK